MATHIEAKIVDGLLAHFAGLTLPAGVTIAYPNKAFVPPAEQAPYVRLSVSKNTPLNTNIGGGMEPIRRGLFLAMIFWPAGDGIIEPSELAGDIRDRFAFNTRINHGGIEIWITDEPAVNGDDQGPVYTQIPVVIPWSVYP